MPTQKEIAEHLGISQQAVSAQLAPLNHDWRNASLDETRLRYLDHLRAVAAGHRTEDGIDLVKERALSERVKRQVAELDLAERLKTLIRVDQLEPELQRMVAAFRTELLSRDDKLKAEIDAVYGIDLDLSLLTEHTRNALKQLARFDAGSAGAAGPAGEGLRAAGDPHDNGMGDAAAAPVG